MELAGEVPESDGNAGLLQPRCILIALVAKWIGANGHNICWRQATNGRRAGDARLLRPLPFHIRRTRGFLVGPVYGGCIRIEGDGHEDRDLNF
jgi:hypothetical protein